MGKNIFLILLFVLGTTVVMTTSFVYPPPVRQPDKLPVASTEKNSFLSDESNDDDHEKSEDSSEFIDNKEQMLCNVIVRATHDLHVYQSKSADEIITYLDMDCKNLGTEELIEQCRELVTQHGTEIYQYVANGIDMDQVCKKIEDREEMGLDDEKTAECSREDGDKCRCCKIHVEKRKMRLRYIVKQMAKKRMCMCKRSPRPHRCRQWIRREERRALQRIKKICPFAVCKHLGYCDSLSENNIASKLQIKPKIVTAVDSPSLWVQLLDRELEDHLTKDTCSEFEQLQTLCIHIGASIDSQRYAKIYMAALHNDTTWIDNGLREEVQSMQNGVNIDLCGACKSLVQSSVDFYQQNLESVRHVLDSTCGTCPEKAKCEEFFNKRLDKINAYLHSLKVDEFCSAVHICSSLLPIAHLPVKDNEKCATCVQHIQPRKNAAIQAVNRLSVYFTDLCTKADMPQCQEFVSEVMNEAHTFINEFNVEETCLAMGFCEENAAHDMDDYEHAFVDEIGKQMCSTLGPFEALCQKVVQGDSKQVQTISLNTTNIDDLFLQCEEDAVSATTDQCSKDKDKCQCCINRVIQKKKCLKRRVAKYVWHMLRLCKRCPAQEKCEHYWKEKEACWDAKIDKICPKKVCIRMGYCKKTETAPMCAYMGPFSQVCEQALNIVGQFFEEGSQQPFVVVVNPVPVKSKDENEKQSAANKP